MSSKWVRSVSALAGGFALICASSVRNDDVALGQQSGCSSASCTGGGRRGEIRQSLPGGGEIWFDPNGPFGAIRPGIDHGGTIGGGGSSRGRDPHPDPLPFQPIDVEVLDAAIRTSNAARCLTQMGFQCEPAPPSLGGRLNERSTRVLTTWLASRVGRELQGDMLLPDIVIQANPDPGIVNIDSWFWVDPSTYGGQLVSDGAELPVPWTLFWDEIVHHHDAVSGPCARDPSQSCVVSFHDWDETITRQESHVDVLDISVTLTPGQYVWDFGDDHPDLGDFRRDSHAAFPDTSGLGKAFTDPNHPSSVLHKYQQSSLGVFDLGGFSIHLTVTWSATGSWRLTSDVGDNSSGSVALDPRVGNYTMRHQVRESQPVIVNNATGTAAR
jgi:hypothetical protein